MINLQMMKQYILQIVPVFAILLFLSSCEDYLNIPPDAAIDENEIFGTYTNFQHFQDQLPKFLVDYNRHGPRVNHSIGGECLADYNYSPAYGNSGNYKTLVNSLSIYNKGAGDFYSGGLYDQMWESVRLANVCLLKLEEGYPLDATEEQKDFLRGQAHFFRAYFHYEYVRSFGTIPYVDEVFAADKQNMKRHWTYEKDGKEYKDVQAVFERIVEDCELAASFLPEVWEAPNINWGRPTKIAALGFKAKALQYSASPLFNEQATGVNEYNKELLDRCAVACQDVIDLAISMIGTQPEGMNPVNADGLSDWADYRTVFATTQGIQPGTPEVLFKRPVDRYGNAIVTQPKARVYMIKQLSNQTGSNGTQSYLDKWEMADGSRYKLEYDQDPTKRWVNRDPRFKFTFYVHGDQVHTLTCNFSTPMIAGDFNSNAIRKFMCDNVMKDNLMDATYSTPLLRLADIYLTYAEAVFESTGDYSAIPAGLKLSAADAVNKVRDRASMPDVAAALPNYENNPLPGSCELASDPAFRILYRNERAVELAFEGSYWFDIRRWKVAHHKDGVQLQAMHFDVDDDKNVIESSVKRVDQTPFVFKDANYWMPFLDDMIFFTSDWEQNPGW
jgi:hypothetical protein